MAVVLNVYISVGCQIDKDWSIDGYGQEKGPSDDDPLVIRTGFEPMTVCLEGRCINL